MRCDTLRAELSALLKQAAEARVEAKEKQALEHASEQVWHWGRIDYVTKNLPYMRYLKGLIFALDWAAEIEEAADPAWRAEAVREYERAVRWFRRLA